MADCYFGCPRFTFPDKLRFFKTNCEFSKTSRCACRKRSTRARARGDDSVPRVAETREQSTAAMFHVHQDAAPTTQPRSFEQYRYAIEAGLMSPHDARCHILPWESATRDSTVSRSSKRYHDHEDAYADEMNKENADARCVSLASNGSHAAPRANRATRYRRRSTFWISPCVFFESLTSDPAVPRSRPQRGWETVPESRATTRAEGPDMTVYHHEERRERSDVCRVSITSPMTSLSGVPNSPAFQIAPNTCGSTRLPFPKSPFRNRPPPCSGTTTTSRAP